MPQEAAPETRPSPDALLAVAAESARGKLKVFLGAAPGVGKTYAMLQEGRQKKADGVDVVVGVVETHGRAETEALIGDFEIVPRRVIPYKDRTLTEMDIDAILARRPALVLVDELAHTNAPGSRHPKRYLDVEELLDAGINVYSTVNVQHVESLNDVVARITRIRVRETVPDRIIDTAAAIEVVDITPEELIERLEEGKVYVREQAQRAIRHYFSPGNITALRELALRRTAERVDEQMLRYMRSHAISGPWAAGERILACVNETEDAQLLVRAAKRLADRLRAPWLALYVETARHARLSDRARDRIAETLRLAERLGGETLTLTGQRVADDVLALARERNVTQIIVGKSQRSRWFELLHGSVVHDLVARSGSISVHVIAGETPAKRDRATAPSRTAAPFEPMPYAAGLLLAAVATLLGKAVEAVIPITNVSLVFVAAVLVSAVWHGLWPSVLTAVVSSLAFNFFFLPPLYEFTIAEPANVVALFFFLLVAVLTSSLGSRMRAQSVAARRQAEVTAQLYGFSRKIAGIAELDDLLWAAAHQVAAMLKVEVVLLIPEGESLSVRAGFPPEDRLDESDVAAARWSWDHDKPAGRGADTLPGARRLFLPLRTGRGKVGVIGVMRSEDLPLLAPSERRLLDALADQIAVAIERITLARDVDDARILSETERLRSALLTSISHDLKTPLASIMGAITSLRSYGALYDAAARDEMLGTALEEAERLNRFVANLLDMTRLDSGALAPRREAVDLGDLVATALRRLARPLASHRVKVDLPADLPLLQLDFVLTEQVLVNLLENAAKYAPAGSEITIRAALDDDALVIDVLDRGPGIPPEALARIFDKFYRVHAGDRQRAGTGLGLAICRGFVEAQGGTIAARNRAAGPGAAFRIIFPRTHVLAAPPATEAEAT